MRRLAVEPAEVASWITPVDAQRVVGFGSGGWVVVDAHGVAARGRSGGPDHVVDHRDEVLLAPERTGLMTAYSIADGARRFRFTPTFGALYEPYLLTKSHRRLTLLGVERPIHGHGARPGLSSYLESIETSEGWPADGRAGISDRHRLLFPSATVAAASLGDAIFMALPNEMIQLDEQLEPKRRFEAEFVPLALSIESGPTWHLLAQVSGRVYYWRIGSDGGLTTSMAMPPGAGRVLAPPILSSIGTVAIVLADRVLEIAAGRIRTELGIGRGLRGGPVGAVRTEDDQLLIAAGNQLIAVDPEGGVRAMTELDAALTSPPAIDGQGRLWVATKAALIALAED